MKKFIKYKRLEFFAIYNLITVNQAKKEKKISKNSRITKNKGLKIWYIVRYRKFLRIIVSKKTGLKSLLIKYERIQVFYLI